LQADRRTGMNLEGNGTQFVSQKHHWSFIGQHGVTSQKMVIWILVLFRNLCFPLCTNKFWYIGFEVITAVTIKGSVFWDITPCSPLKVRVYFGRTYRTHLQVLRLKQTRNNKNLVCRLLLLAFCLDYSSTLKMEFDMLLRNMILVGAWLIDGFWIVWLDLLTPYSHNSGLQAIQRYAILHTL
jgi:uncharacterized membrane protein